MKRARCWQHRAHSRLFGEMSTVGGGRRRCDGRFLHSSALAWSARWRHCPLQPRAWPKTPGGPRLERSNRVELRLTVFGEQFHVVRAREADRDLLGARLLAIDDTPVARLREVAHTLRGGLPAWRDREAPLLFESPQQLHALGLAKDREHATYRFETPDGRSLERRLPAQAPSPTRPRADPPRLLLPELTPERHEGADTGHATWCWTCG
jgi:hypothetical protein